MPITLSHILARTEADGLEGFTFFHYVPSIAGAVLFIILFLGTSALHGYQMFTTRTWFLVPFFLGGVLEVIGNIARAACWSESPDYTLGPYIIQSIMLLVAPSLLAASVYMELANIVLMVDGDAHLFIRRTWLTRTFVIGDVLSFLMQSTGAGMMSSGQPSMTDLGTIIVIIGLVLQLIFFGLLVAAGLVFHARLNKVPIQKSSACPWEKHMCSLYGVSVLIFVRCVVRAVEYGQGYDGYIISHEAFLYVFDALLMWIAMVILNWTHPSGVWAYINGGKYVTAFVRLDDLS